MNQRFSAIVFGLLTIDPLTQAKRSMNFFICKYIIGENYDTYLQKPWFDEFIDTYVINKFYEKCKSNMISITVSTLLGFFSLSGMASVLRFCRHHPDYLLVEYKPLLQHVMKHVKNLRSQVNYFIWSADSYKING